MTRVDDAAPATARYRDATLPLEARVADLLARMTLDEKLAQLGSVWAFQVAPHGRVDRSAMASLLGNGIGELTRLAGATNLAARDVAGAYDEIQRFVVERTRLGIPVIVHEETLHGLLARDAPCFQQSIGAAATWDPDLVGAMAETIRRRMLATGARHALAPVLDLARDPRWGRIEETYGEDPYLAAAMGVAYVRGIQGADGEDGIIATGKHFAAHGQSEGGLNQAPVHAGWRELRDEYLLPFEAAIREAGLRSVMPAYTDLDGMPCHASCELLGTILRGEWGFDGMVVADYRGIEQIAAHHRLTDDLAAAAALALDAGVDVELPRSAAYAEPLRGAIASGHIDESLVDASVARVLGEKFRLGLFERPYVEPPSEVTLSRLAEDERRVGRELARRSLVLLENDGSLPLASDLRRVAVVGHIAGSARELLGDYSHVVHIATLLEMRAGTGTFGYELSDGVSLEDESSGRLTILDALRQRLGSDVVAYAPGAGPRGGSDADIAEAVETARSADVALVFLGERSGLTEDSTTGEFRDRRELGLLGRQQELLEAVVATGTPVILVVVSGRPLALEWAARACAAVLFAWVPGDEGPGAIVDVLLGDVSPGGKLPVTVPRHVGQVPLHYRHHPSGGRSNWKGDHVDGPAGPLWAFGSGRSYTTFEVSDLVLGAPSIPVDGGRVEVHVGVRNIGHRPGDEVVQLYMRDEQARVARPVLELCGFRRVTLGPREAATIRFMLHAEQFAHTGPDYRRIVEPGAVTLSAGTSSADLPLSATLELTGPTVPLPERTRFLTDTTVRPTR